MSELVYLLPFLIALALLMLIATGADGSTHARAGLYAIESADHLARGMRQRSVFVLAVIGALIAYITFDENMVAMMEFSSPVYVIVAIAAIARWVEARRALRMLAAGEVTASVVDNVVICESRGQRTVMHASAWLVDRSRRHGLPRASV